MRMVGCPCTGICGMAVANSVAAVENGRTPDGEPYDWSKAGRAGNSRKNAQEPPKLRKDSDV